MDSKSPNNKIREIVRLKKILQKWKKVAVATKISNSKKSISFLSRTLSLPEAFPVNAVPKGCVAVCVGEEMKRFVIPMDCLGHEAFRVLLKEAEEEFGFQHEGLLRIPCEVSEFESILKAVRRKEEGFFRRCSSQTHMAQYSKTPNRQKTVCS